MTYGLHNFLLTSKTEEYFYFEFTKLSPTCFINIIMYIIKGILLCPKMRLNEIVKTLLVILNLYVDLLYVIWM